MEAVASEGRGGAPERVGTALVVHGARELRAVVVKKLRLVPVAVYQAVDAYDGLRHMSSTSPDIVIADLSNIERDLDLIARIREFSDVPIIALTSQPSVAACERAMIAGAQRFLEWPDAADMLADVVIATLSTRTRSPVRKEIDVSDARRRSRDDLRNELERLLRECNGNIAMMSERLQRDRSTVTYHLKRLGLFPREPASGRSREARTSN